jgi:PqqD family protein of HPr-rel-A system
MIGGHVESIGGEEDWRIVALDRLAWRSWDHETVIYNDLSGDTHLLEPLATLVFEALSEGPASLAQLERRAAEAVLFDVPADVIARRLRDVLARLQRLSLIEPA